MKTQLSRAALAVLLSIAVVPGFQACAPGPEPGEVGSPAGEGEAEVGIAVDALSFAEVTKVTVSVTGDGISPDITAHLAKVKNQ